MKLRERGKKDPLHRLIRAWKERGDGSWVLIPFKNREDERILKNVVLKTGNGIAPTFILEFILPSHYYIGDVLFFWNRVFRYIQDISLSMTNSYDI